MDYPTNNPIPMVMTVMTATCEDSSRICLLNMVFFRMLNDVKQRLTTSYNPGFSMGQLVLIHLFHEG